MTGSRPPRPRGTDVTPSPGPTVIRTDIPARLDRLPWSRFHLRLVVALGVCWVLDGYEAVVVSNIGVQLRVGMDLDDATIGLIATSYLAGQAVGALLFGRFTDRRGRRGLFFLTLAIYMLGSLLTVVVPATPGALPLLFVFRFVAGLGLGGEYAAINSMIDELIPRTYRGRTDIIVNGTYWLGASLASLAQLALFSDALWPDGAGSDWRWRVALALGPVVALGVWFLRRGIPESPRWLLLHRAEADAEASVRRIEREVRSRGGVLAAVAPPDVLSLRPRRHRGYRTLFQVLVRTYPERAVLGLVLMITQSLVYNAFFFTQPSILTRFYGVLPTDTAIFLLPFALGNLFGPLVLGPLFDRVGRRPMLARTYGTAGVLLLANAVLFQEDALSPVGQTFIWCVIFFFASAGACAAYLTISEVFPLEVRAESIAVVLAVTQAVGALAPWVFGRLIDVGTAVRGAFTAGIVGAAVLMLVGAAVARLLAVKAENRSLEQVAPPLALVGDAGRDVSRD